MPIRIIRIIFKRIDNSCFSGVISDDEHDTGHHHNPMDNEDEPHGNSTPPTPLLDRLLQLLQSQFVVHGALKDDKVKQFECLR